MKAITIALHCGSLLIEMLTSYFYWTTMAVMIPAMKGENHHFTEMIFAIQKQALSFEQVHSLHCFLSSLLSLCGTQW